MAVQKRKLNYRFHNPNTEEATADYIIKLFVEVNHEKVGRAMQEAANEAAEIEESSRCRNSA